MRKLLETFLNDIWYEGKGAPIKIALLPLSFIYGVLSWLRFQMFTWGIKKKKKLPIAVISVGNIVVGGAGKTPLAIYLATMLQNLGIKPAIVSRGYGGKRDGTKVNIVSDGTSLLLDEEMAGEEAVLLASRLPGVPVLVGSNRFDLGRKAISEFGVEAIILDDGFQHLCLHRDMDICVVQAMRGLGNGIPLPSGPLREFASALKRADVLVLNGFTKEEITLAAGKIQAGRGIDKPLLGVLYLPKTLEKNGKHLSLEFLRDKRICAFCGIGNPQGFRRTLKGLGGICSSFITYPDHHRYDRQDIAHIKRTALETDAQVIITTEKDAVKVKKFPFFFEEITVLTIAVAPPLGDNRLYELLKHISKKS